MGHERMLRAWPRSEEAVHVEVAFCQYQSKIPCLLSTMFASPPEHTAPELSLTNQWLTRNPGSARIASERLRKRTCRAADSLSSAYLQVENPLVHALNFIQALCL